MKLSKKGEYSLMAIIVLLMHYGKDTLQTKEIAEQENIPVKFLEQILLN
ncbi:MAG: Rrf2 family transcriptional regulator [candidate division WOR-3 bacterium]|nr:Rrf2 family transcriptional regulator [candidate division WOR-3 bacterium]